MPTYGGGGTGQYRPKEVNGSLYDPVDGNSRFDAGWKVTVVRYATTRGEVRLTSAHPPPSTQNPRNYRANPQPASV